MTSENRTVHLQLSGGKRPYLIGGGLVTLGGVLVAAGAVIPGLSDYASSIFLTIGTAIGLIGPLSVGQSLLNTRVKETTQAVADVGATSIEALETAKAAGESVASLQRELGDRLAQNRAKDLGLQQRAAEGSQEALIDVYEAAADRRWIDPRGLRVSTNMDGLWLRVHVLRTPGDQATRRVELAFEGPELEPVGKPIAWAPGEKPVPMLERLGQALQDARRYPGDVAFRQSALLPAVAGALGKIRELHSGLATEVQVGPVVELVDDDWAITSDRLESLDGNIHISRSELFEGPDKAFQRIEPSLGAKGGSQDAFSSIFKRASHVHRGLLSEQSQRNTEQTKAFSEILGRAGF